MNGFDRWRCASKGSIIGLTIFLAACSGSNSGGSAAAPACNSTTGLSAPLQTCTAGNPCTRPAPDLGVAQISEPSSAPLCMTTAAGRTVYDDGPPLQWTDPDNVTRYACLFSPAGASDTSKRPLVIWMHGGGSGTADDLYNFTSLRGKAPGYDLTGDPTRPGFFLLAIDGRNLHYPTEADRDGRHHDFYYRGLASPSGNPDIANVDRLIDNLVAGGTVDAKRIYMMGWSNGAFFSQMYSIARQNTPSPGGNAPAAVVAFTGADPFHNTNVNQDPSCQLDPYPTSQASIFLVSRSCDIVACDATQAADLETKGVSISPGHIVSDWVADLQNKVMNPNVSRRIVSGTGQTVASCTAPQFCTAGIAVLNHLRWPDGVADSSGIDHEPDMLDYLKGHILP